MTHDSNKPVEMLAVTQEDREAAASLWLEFQGAPHSPRDLALAQEFSDGERDDDEFTQAFARHRLSSTPTADRNAAVSAKRRGIEA